MRRFITYFISDNNIFTDVELDNVGLTKGFIINGGWWFPNGLSADTKMTHYATLDELYVYRTEYDIYGSYDELRKDIETGRKEGKILKFTELLESDKKHALENSQRLTIANFEDEDSGDYKRPSQDELRQILENKFTEMAYVNTRLIAYSIKGIYTSHGAGGYKTMALEEIDARPHYYEFWDGDVTVIFMDKVYDSENNKSIAVRGG